MNDIEWKAMAILAGRKLRTKQGSLASCLREFLSLSDTEWSAARIVIPDCIRLGRSNAIRTLSGEALAALADKMPVGRAFSAR